MPDIRRVDIRDSKYSFEVSIQVRDVKTNNLKNVIPLRTFNYEYSVREVKQDFSPVRKYAEEYCRMHGLEMTDNAKGTIEYYNM